MEMIRLSFIIGTLSFLLCTTAAEDENVLKVTVFYESKCSDSMSFFTQQLEPTYEKIGQYLKIDLVPYGKAEGVKLTLFYEANCPFCMEFITQQVQPTFEKIGKYMKVDLVPYGNARHKVSNGTYTFTCQHGPDECRYNKIHSCTLKYLSDENQVVDFISCLMVVKNEDKVLEKCAKKSNVDLKKINTCSNSHEGDVLLAAYGDRTHSFKPTILGVPTIVFNDKYDDDDQDLAQTNLLEAICKKLEPKPKECDQSRISVMHVK